jgi:ribonuclease P protein component
LLKLIVLTYAQGVNITNDQENLSAEQPPPREKTRVSLTNGDEKRARRDCAPPGEGTQTPDSAPLLKTIETPEIKIEKIDFSLPKAEHLRKPAEFQLVYKNGKRFDGRFMSAFILPNNLPVHRFGITASRKAVGNAVERNRAKRLLREAFRLSKIELKGLSVRYDFVINARRNLLTVKMQEPLADFRKVIGQIKLFEENSQQKAVVANLTAE